MRAFFRENWFNFLIILICGGYLCYIFVPRGSAVGHTPEALRLIRHAKALRDITDKASLAWRDALVVPPFSDPSSPPPGIAALAAAAAANPPPALTKILAEAAQLAPAENAIFEILLRPSADPAPLDHHMPLAWTGHLHSDGTWTPGTACRDFCGEDDYTEALFVTPVGTHGYSDPLPPGEIAERFALIPKTPGTAIVSGGRIILLPVPAPAAAALRAK